MGSVMSLGKSQSHRASKLLYGYNTLEQNDSLGHSALRHMPKELHAVAYSPDRCDI